MRQAVMLGVPKWNVDGDSRFVVPKRGHVTVFPSVRQYFRIEDRCYLRTDPDGDERIMVVKERSDLMVRIYWIVC